MITPQILRALQLELEKISRLVEDVQWAFKQDKQLERDVAQGMNVRGRADVAGLRRTSLDVTKRLVELRETPYDVRLRMKGKKAS